ncbi:MAG: helix-turn-helix transcriptional regulator [Opitutaceae bacterium]|nr:helix-turn-helix transcriptional regulator [Opitutaceae bacterium]
MNSIPRFGRGSARTLPTHRDFGLEIIYLEKGALNWHVEGRVERVTAGSVYFSLPWQEHGSVDEFEPGHYWHWVQLGLDGRIDRPRRRFGFHPDFGIGRAEAAEISALLTQRGRHCCRATPRIAWLVPTLVEELMKSDSPEIRYVQALARLAVLELARCLKADAAHDRNDSASLRRVEAFIIALQARSDETWTLSDMAAACGLGRSRFALLCRQLTGDSPFTLVNRLRVDRAKSLLKATPKSVTEIAHECGFSTSQYFARVFRHFTGLDARGYRQRHRGGK